MGSDEEVNIIISQIMLMDDGSSGTWCLNTMSYKDDVKAISQFTNRGEIARAVYKELLVMSYGTALDLYMSNFWAEWVHGTRGMTEAVVNMQREVNKVVTQLILEGELKKSMSFERDAIILMAHTSSYDIAWAACIEVLDINMNILTGQLWGKRLKQEWDRLKNA